MLDLPGVRVRLPEDLQGLVLGRSREGKVAGVGQYLPGFHDAVDAVLRRLVVLGCPTFGQGYRHRRCGAPALAGMRLVDEDGEPAPPVLVPDLVEDERELLDRGDDDLPAALDELPEVSRMLGVAHRRAHLSELADRGLDLLVKDAPVGDHDDGVEYLHALPPQADPGESRDRRWSFDLPLPAECWIR